MREHKNSQPLFWLMAMFACVSFLFMGTSAQASQIDKSHFVDSIVLDKTEAYTGEIVKLNITFSEKSGHTFAPGDEMVFDLPSELEAFESSMKLEDYAVVTVKDGRAVVRFTDKVKVKDHIKGGLSFNVKVNEVAKDSEHDVNLGFGTNINQSLKVKGHKSSTGGEQTRHKPAYKGGWVDTKDPTILHWYIVVNANRDPIHGDVKVTDAVGKGHIYIEDSFEITGNPNVPAPKVKIGANNHYGDKFSVTLPENFVSGQTVGINYQTRLTKEGKKMNELTNKFSATFADGNNNPESINDGARLANLLMSGVIEGDETLNQGTEGTVDPMPEETTDEILPIVPENGHESKVENELEDGIHGTDPEIHNLPKEEELPAEEEVDEIAPIKPEKGDESNEGPHTEDGIHGSDTEVHIDESEEVNPSEEVDVIDPITPEHIDGKIVEDDKIDPIKPEPKPDVKPMPAPKPDVKPMPAPKPDVKPTPAPKPDVKPTPAPKPENKVVEPKKAETKNVEKNEDTLPNTGNVDNFALTIIGLLGMIFAGFVMIRRDK